MPLLDHFHPPLSRHRHWQAFHSAWAGTIARLLNQDLLPARYFAEPHVQFGGPVEIDVAAFEETGELSGGSAAGGVATARWAPSRPTLTAPLPFGSLDTVEVRIHSEEEGPVLVAAIELVSPANKDRPAHRKAFVTKCAAYLQQGVSLTAVDLVTSREADLHGDLLRALEVEPEPPSSALWSASYRVEREETPVLEAWYQPLRLGEVLPTLPLWLGAGLAVPLNLEASYRSTCEALRIPG